MRIHKINSDEVIEEIFKKRTEKPCIVLYGAGNYGLLFKQYLNKEFNKDIIGFAVTRGEKKKKILDGKPVVCLDEVDINSTLVISVSEQKQKELIMNAERYGFSEIYILLNDFVEYIRFHFMENKMTPMERLSFEVHVVEHCNLNCKGCYHFSPLAREEYLEVNEFRRDLDRIEELFNQDVERITLLGGEPLLHPMLKEFFYAVRNRFPKCRLELLTNGLLLNQMNVDFWKTLERQNVELNCTKYPVSIDYGAIEKKANLYGINVGYHNDIGAGEKMLIKYPFDEKGCQDIVWNYAHCTRSNFCITLKHGKIFTCPMAAHAHLLKDFFHLDIELAPEDYINIYEAKSKEEITEFLLHPIPFCRYCNLKKHPEQINWEKSNKKLNEWF